MQFPMWGVKWVNPACGHKHLREVPVLSGRKTNCFIYDQVRYVSLYRKIVIIERKSYKVIPSH